jgi:hypothetical protein
MKNESRGKKVYLSDPDDQCSRVERVGNGNGDGAIFKPLLGGEHAHGECKQ